MTNTNAQALPTVQSIETLINEYYENVQFHTLDKEAVEKNFESIKASYATKVATPNPIRKRMDWEKEETELDTLHYYLRNLDNIGAFESHYDVSGKSAYTKFAKLLSEGYTTIEENGFYHLFDHTGTGHNFGICKPVAMQEKELEERKLKLVADMERIVAIKNEELLCVNKASEYAQSKHAEQQKAYEDAIAKVSTNYAEERAQKAKVELLAKLQNKTAFDVLLDENKPFYTYDELKAVSGLEVDSEVSALLKSKGLESKKVTVDTQGARAMRWVKQA